MAEIESAGMVDSLELKVFRPQKDGSMKQIAERKTIPASMHPWKKAAICFLQNFGLFKGYHKDLITNAGLVDIKTLVLAQYGYVAIGTGTTPAAAADTSLETQVEARVVPTKTTVTTTITNDTAQFSGAFTLTGNRAITESGVFAISSGGVMLCRQVFSALNLSTNDVVTFVWKIQISR